MKTLGVRSWKILRTLASHPLFQAGRGSLQPQRCCLLGQFLKHGTGIAQPSQNQGLSEQGAGDLRFLIQAHCCAPIAREPHTERSGWLSRPGGSNADVLAILFIARLLFDGCDVSESCTSLNCLSTPAAVS